MALVSTTHGPFGYPHMPRPAALPSTTITMRAAHKKQYSRTGSLPSIGAPYVETQALSQDRIGVNEILKFFDIFGLASNICKT